MKALPRCRTTRPSAQLERHLSCKMGDFVETRMLLPFVRRLRSRVLRDALCYCKPINYIMRSSWMAHDAGCVKLLRIN